MSQPEDSKEAVTEGLKKSKQILDHIYPVLTEKGTMTILDGKTRKKADPTWPEREIEITDPKQRILIPMHANYRRKIPRRERQTQLLMLASILEKEGIDRFKIIPKLVELTPFTERYIRILMPAKYKATQMRRKISAKPRTHPTPVKPERALPSPARVETVPRGTSCPKCGTLVETVLCPRCLSEMPLRKIKT